MSQIREEKRGYKFKKIFREKDRVCIGFEEPKRKKVKKKNIIKRIVRR